MSFGLWLLYGSGFVWQGDVGLMLVWCGVRITNRLVTGLVIDGKEDM